MSEDEIFEQTKGAYLCLVHPVPQDHTYLQEIASVIALAPSVPKELVASLITGPSWRERLLGLCMAMAKQPAAFIDSMLRSLRDPRAIAIVPTCAALAVMARSGVFVVTPSFSEMFDRSAFDGEVGWAADKVMHFVGLRSEDVSERGPNYGQNFDDHFEAYSLICAI